MTIDQQVASDEAVVPHASQLRIGKSNFRLRSNITSKESTLQVVYDVLRLTPFYKAFLVTADMNNKKRIVNLEYFKEMLHICPRIPNQTFDELPFEEEILAFLRYIGHSGEIKITDKNVDFAYLLWEDFVYQVEHKDAKKSNEMYYPRYIDHRMNEAVAVQLQSDRLRDEAQAENEDFLNKLDENIQKIIKEQVKVQVSKILPKIEKTVNEQLEAEVLTRASNSSKTSYAVVADLSVELKKILIEKMKSNKSIHRCDEQKNLYKALVDAYECDKIILDTYRDTITLKRRRDDEDKDEEPSAGSDRGSKRRRASKEPESTSAPKEKASKTSGKSTEESKSHQKTASESAPAEEPMQTTLDLKEPSHQEFETASPTYELMKGSCKSLVELEFFLEEVYKATTDQLDWNNPEGQQYPHNLLKPLPLIPNSRGRRVIPFDHFINNDLEYLCGGASSRKYTTSVTKTKAADYGHIKWIEDLVPRTMWSQAPVSYDKYALWKISHWRRKRKQFYGFGANKESTRDVYSKRRIIAVTKLHIVEWHNYKHLDWITVRREDDKLYKFKEGDLKRLRIQDIEDMLLLLFQGKLTDLTRLRIQDIEDMLLVLFQGKLTDLTVEERFAFNVSLMMFTRSIVIQRRVKDLQLGVESYQKKAQPHKAGYVQIDGTLNDVRTALDDRLKGIRMKYLPQTIWRRSDKERAAAMI
nr:hypothetical protein [Tanacetum cinerariifolium]